jgi:hypothetical protein
VLLKTKDRMNFCPGEDNIRQCKCNPRYFFFNKKQPFVLVILYITVTNIQEKQFKGENAYSGSQFQRSHGRKQREVTGKGWGKQRPSVTCPRDLLPPGRSHVPHFHHLSIVCSNFKFINGLMKAELSWIQSPPQSPACFYSSRTTPSIHEPFG